MSAKPFFLSVPFINDLLSSPRIKPYMERLTPGAVLSIVRGSIDDISGEMVTVATKWRMPDIGDLIDKVVARLQDAVALEPTIVVDGRSRLFPTSSGRNGLAILEELATTVAHGGSESIVPLISRLTGAEDAIVFQSPQVARMAILETFCRRSPLLIARCDCCENQSGERITDLIRFQRIKVNEIGVSNKVHFQDYLSGVDSPAGLLYLSIGSHNQQRSALSPAELLTLKEKFAQSEYPILCDVEYAPIQHLSSFLLQSIPSASDYLKAGYDLILFSGDQLVGGPRCGIVAGAKRLIGRLREAIHSQLFPPHVADMAWLERTVINSVDLQTATNKIPILQQISTSVANLQNRGARLIPQLDGCSLVRSVEQLQGKTPLYLGAEGIVTTSLLAVVAVDKKPEELARCLAQSKPQLLVDVREESVMIDLRSIPPMHDSLVIEAFDACESRESKGTT